MESNYNTNETALAERNLQEKKLLKENFLPGPVLLLGAPGVGKGTQAKILMSLFEIPQISTGDLLRDHRVRHTSLGLMADGLMSQGKLVPDDLVNKMVEERLEKPDCERGYILDGFPRTLNQSKWIDRFIADRGPLAVISLVVDRGDLLRRITGRRLCEQGHIYNIYTNPPLREGVCDVDGSVLMQRQDDTEAVFEHRMKVFDADTLPVVQHYRASGNFGEIDGFGEVEAITASIMDRLRTFRTPHRGGPRGR